MNVLAHSSARIGQALAAALLSAAASWSGSAIADDTELFFPPVDVTAQENIRPNILFIMDTSGSMGNTDSGQSKTRLELVQDAMSQLLTEMNQNVNAGLMRLSYNEGGPILFPVAHLEQQASVVESRGSCAVSAGGGGGAGGLSGLVQPDVRIIEGNDVAIEYITSTEVELNPEVAFVGGEDSDGSVGSTSTTVTTIFPSGDRDDVAQENGDRTRTNRDELRLGNRIVGTRFPDIAIPPGATIDEAKVHFTLRNDDRANRNDGSTQVDISVESNTNPQDYDDNDTISGRSYLGGALPWDVPEPVSDDDTVIESRDISSLVQQIIDAPGWSEGNALAIRYSDSAGRRNVHGSSDSARGANLHPKLEITYTVGGGQLVGPFSPEARNDDDENGQGQNSPDEDLGQRRVGIRFRNVTVPQGSFVTNAYVEFTRTDSNGEQQSDADVRIFGHDVDDAPDFDSNSDLDNYFGDTTSASVEWLNIPDPGSNGAVTSPDISSIIQEIVQRGGWDSGNDLNLLFDDLGGNRAVYSYDGTNNQNFRPRLYVNYQTGLPATQKAMAGLRFQDVRVPQGVTITSATLDLRVGNAVDDDSRIDIVGEDVDDSPAFTDGDGALSARASAGNVTSEVKDFTEADPWTPSAATKTADVTAVVQEIINRDGWCGGNAMSLFLKPRSMNTALRHFDTYRTVPDGAPRLQISYDEDSPEALSGCTVKEFVTQIDAGDDDAEEASSIGDMLIDGNVLDLNTSQTIGLRFNNIQVLRDAEIVDAYIEFTAQNGDSGTATYRIFAENVAHADPIIDRDDELDDRSNCAGCATSEVTWNPENWTDNEKYSTSSVSSVVDEITSRADWRPGFSMLFFIEGSQGLRRAETFNSSPSSAAKLFIVFKGGVVDPDATPPGPTVRDRLRSTVADFNNYGNTPLAEVYTEAAYYFRGDNVFFGRSRGSADDLDSLPSGAERLRISHCASYIAGVQNNPEGCSDANLGSESCSEQFIQSATVTVPAAPADSCVEGINCTDQTVTGPRYISPITQSCQSNNIVLLSDGIPNNNNRDSLITDITGGSCTGSTDAGCAVDLARFLATEDQSDLIEGDQVITTYSVGFGADVGSGTAFLEELAEAGGGRFFETSSADELVDFFQAVVAEILDQNTTFVAPGVTVNSFSRLSHLDQLYFALFRPDNRVRWPGNLKRYRLANVPSSIADITGADAVDPSTGFFKDSARSFWNEDATSPDGGNVTEGGAADELTASRTVLTNLGTSGSLVAMSTSNVTPALMGLAASETDKRDDAVAWGKGLDPLDEDGDGDTDDARFSLGDPLHSEPQVVTYGSSAGDPQTMVFMGTNEGYLHAFDGDDGSETWSFIPKEFLPNLVRYMDNSGSYTTRPYGVDGPITVHDGRPTPGAAGTVTLIVSMRRGGKFLYALDVTDPTSPSIRWVKRRGDTGYEELGETWSRPVVAKIKVGTTAEEVVFIGGGYDTGQDAKDIARTADDEGRALYAIRISDGAVVWSAGPTADHDVQLTSMQASIPATPRVIDLDTDGFADRVYVGDMNGKIFRFDFYKKNSGAGDMAKGYLYADLAVDGVESANRRFYNEISVALIKPYNSESLLTLAVGSGFRAHPLEQDVNDLFFILKDYDAAPVFEEDSTDPRYRKAYFELPQDFDVNLDGTLDSDEEADTLGALGPIRISGGVDSLVDASSNSATVQEQFARSRGGYITLRSGEKILARALTFDNEVTVTSFQPGSGTGNPCQAGTGQTRQYRINVHNFGPAGTPRNPDDPDDPANRDEDLNYDGLPPDPKLLFVDDDDDGRADRVERCIGAVCEDTNADLSAQKSFWSH